MIRIPCVWMRAGTSKAAFLLKDNLPASLVERDNLILKLMGSPDMRQIDGIGGGDPLSSKVAIVSKLDGTLADVSFLFAQVLLDKPQVNTQANCGNILSGVAPFAIEKGLVQVTSPETVVRIYNENTLSVVTATVQTPNGVINYNGNFSIDGVPGTASPINLNFGNVIGTTTGKLFPTGNQVDCIDGVDVSCIDVSIPVIFISAKSLGKNGHESKQELDSDKQLLSKIEEIRKKVIDLMGVRYSSLIPKVSLVSMSSGTGNITSRYFTPMYCHAAHAVTGALCLATACQIDGTVPSRFAKSSSVNDQFIVEHPAGVIPVSIKLARDDSDNFILERAEIFRTARPLFEGNVLIREDINAIF